MKKILLLSSFLLFVFSAFAQKTFPYNGVTDHRDGLYAFTNATIFKTYNEKIENATLVIKNGKVIACGSGARVPSDAVVIDASGKTIYPAFVDIFSGYGMPLAIRGEGGGRRSPQMLSKKKGAYSWNQALRSEFDAAENFAVDKKAAKELRKIGFGAVMAHRPDGISRGTGALVALGEDREHEMLLTGKSGHIMSFQKGVSTQSNPNSLMGIIALLRQTYLDADWYKNGGNKEEKNLSLEAWNDAQNLPQIFAVGNKLEALRAAKIAKEFGKKYIIKGNGDEYQRADALRKTGSVLVIPVNYPDAYDVENPYDAQSVELSDMKHWELAPSNASFLAKAGIEFSFTTDGLKNKGDFLKNIKTAIKRGLSEETALKALTHTPANLVNAGSQVGNLREGSVANFLITDGNIFGKKTKIHHSWVKGKPFVINEPESEKPTGVYSLNVGAKNYLLHLHEDGKTHLEINDSTKVDVKFSLKKGIVNLSFDDPAATQDLSLGKKIRLTGTYDNMQMSGQGNLSNGNWTNWNAGVTRAILPNEEKKPKKEDKAEELVEMGDIVYPFMAFGWNKKPESKAVLFQNATVWTNEKDGVLENTSVLIRDGKISQIGGKLKPSGNVEVVDATGKHLTCGVVDEHTHIAGSRGINEGSQASSAEVRIGDIVNSEDINIYRQLAGGVTTAQILHGSANPIGGQSAIIKFRWGFEPEEMKYKGADGFIKFALGENVKQSNWGDASTVRFPQTRMGVEQVFVDHFTRALDYKKLKSSGKPYRKDLEMECLQEIVESRRFISCHSYVQSEVNMLMKVAEQFDFRINTFTHILEGYKVADKMAKHGAGGSTFSDWWAYKYEVIDAIPFNAAIMHEQGVTVAINSDDAEMARRLNQEAAKAIKYGGMSEEDAWKTVTLNPAKLLHLDDKVGSIKIGKDADVVLWSDNPLSIYAKAEQTYVDGIKFFDREQDALLQNELESERNRLIQKMLSVKKGGGKMQGVPGKKHHHYHCDDEEDEG